MSQENVEILRRLTLGTREDDLAAAWATAAKLLHPNVEMDTTRIPVPGLARIYTGPEQVAQFWRGWLDAWGGFGDFEYELIDAGDQALSWITHQKMRGKGSGIEVEMPEYGWVVTVRDRKVMRATLYMNRGEALEAAGLRE